MYLFLLVFTQEGPLEGPRTSSLDLVLHEIKHYRKGKNIREIKRSLDKLEVNNPEIIDAWLN